MNESIQKLKPLKKLEKLDFNPSTDDSKILFQNYKDQLKRKNSIIQKINEQEVDILNSKEFDQNLLFRLGSAGKEKYLQHYKDLDKIIEIDKVY